MHLGTNSTGNKQTKKTQCSDNLLLLAQLHGTSTKFMDLNRIWNDYSYDIIVLVALEVQIKVAEYKIKCTSENHGYSQVLELSAGTEMIRWKACLSFLCSPPLPIIYILSGASLYVSYSPSCFSASYRPSLVLLPLHASLHSLSICSALHSLVLYKLFNSFLKTLISKDLLLLFTKKLFKTPNHLVMEKI